MQDQPRPRLTAYSQRRADSGVTRGSGTDVCAVCRKPKEPARVNYMKCTACARPQRWSTPSTGPSVTRRTRIYKGQR